MVGFDDLYRQGGAVTWQAGKEDVVRQVVDLLMGLGSDARVLDFGCGTGILAIIAAKLGAAHVDAIDNEVPAYESTQENALINHTPAVHSLLGTLENVATDNYAVILANINRNVLVAAMPRLREQLASGGTLLLSGILLRDEAKVREATDAAGFVYHETRTKGDWVALRVSAP